MDLLKRAWEWRGRILDRQTTSAVVKFATIALVLLGVAVLAVRL